MNTLDLQYIRDAQAKPKILLLLYNGAGGDKMTETPIAGRSGLRVSGILMDLGNTLYTLRMMYVCTDTVSLLSSRVVKIALKP